MFYDALACSLGMMVVAVVFAGLWPRVVGLVLLLVASCAGLAYALIAPVLLVQTGLLLLVEVVRYIPEHGIRAYRVAAVAASLTAWLLVVKWVVLPEHEEYARIRAAYPPVPVVSLLPPQVRDSGGPRTDGHAIESWEAAVSSHQASGRYSLKAIHERHASLFVNSPGFGMGRRIRPTAEDLRKDREPRVPLAQPGASSRSDIVSAVGRDSDIPYPGKFSSLHFRAAIDFVNPRGYSYLRDGIVAGFMPHQMDNRFEAPDSYFVKTVDLVGLLLRPDPVVYVSEHLPRMEELRGADAPTRPLDPFEAEGLAALRKGDDLFAREAGGRARVLGSLRAAKQCVECHGGTRGDLLGALSYTLSRGK